MANPAELLYDTLTTWITPVGGSLPKKRGLDPNSGATPDFYEHIVVVRHLLAIGEILDSWAADGRSLRPFDDALRRWWAFALAYPTGWRSAVPKEYGEQPGQHDLNYLHLLAEQLRREMPMFSESSLNSIKEAVNETRDLLVTDDSLPEALRQHVFGLLAEADRCIKEYAAFGDFDVSKAVSRMRSAFAVAQARSTRPSAWKIVIDKLALPLFIGVGAAVGGDLAVNAIESSADVPEIVEAEIVQTDTGDGP